MTGAPSFWESHCKADTSAIQTSRQELDIYPPNSCQSLVEGCSQGCDNSLALPAVKETSKYWFWLEFGRMCSSVSMALQSVSQVPSTQLSWPEFTLNCSNSQRLMKEEHPPHLSQVKAKFLKRSPFLRDLNGSVTFSFAIMKMIWEDTEPPLQNETAPSFVRSE